MVVGLMIVGLFVVALVVTAFKYGEAIGEEVGFEEAVKMYEESIKEERNNV